MSRIYLIRHAETPPRPGKPSDGNRIGITSAGRVATRAKARSFIKLGIKKIIASPLTRAGETAKEFGEVLKVPLVTDERAREFVAADVGPPDFKTLRDKARHKRDWAGPLGESFDASIARLRHLFDSVPDGESTVIISHELLMQNMLMSKDGDIPIKLSPLSVITLEKHEHRWEVLSVRQGRNLLQRLFSRFLA
jgi:broad specificity phosphatase PhoE